MDFFRNGCKWQLLNNWRGSLSAWWFSLCQSQGSSLLAGPNRLCAARKMPKKETKESTCRSELLVSSKVLTFACKGCPYSDKINFSWPIFFYGTHETLWIHEHDMRPFEANRETLGTACKKPKFKGWLARRFCSLHSFIEAMIEAFTNPCILFQFEPDDGESIEKWVNGDDSVNQVPTNWARMGKCSTLYHFLLLI